MSVNSANSLHDTREVNSRIVEVCEHYLGPGRREGAKRRIWRCPRCGRARFAANSELECAGCLSPACDVPRATDSLGVIALFEGRQTTGLDFVRCLEKANEILSLPTPSTGSRNARGRDKPASRTTPEQSPQRPEPHAEEQRALRGRVYRRMMELCPLEERDRRFWHSRGVGRRTAEEGGFGSLSHERGRYLLRELRRAFSNEELLTVPGFYPGPDHTPRTNLRGDYTLVPYHDRDGRISTIEGRFTGRRPGPRDRKYKAPVGAANHLYVFPRYRPDDVVAFCEGLIGAVVAARCGLPVASIKGCWCFRRAGARGFPDRPLPELEGVDFGGRRRVYIPDLDVKPATRQEVEELAPLAARWLIAAQNGVPLLARLPDGHKDLDEWLLSLPAAARRASFNALLLAARPPDAHGP